MNKGISSQLVTIPVANSKHYLLLFLLWPFLAFITALTSYSQKESKKVVYLFLIYFGLSYVISSSEGYVDSSGYIMQLKANALLPFSDFFRIVGGLYATDTSVDIVEPLISFIVSRFTNNPRFLFAVFAAVFGFFYLRSINLLYNRYMENSGLNVLMHLAFFTVIIPITSINGFRMWTAAWIFFYGTYHVVLHHDARYLLIALGSSLVHWSFLSANVILIIYFFAGNRNFIYLPLAIASFVVPKLITPLFLTLSLKLGGALQNRYEGYSSEEYLAIRQGAVEAAPWFLRLSNDLVFYYLLLAMIVIQLKSGYLMKEKAERNLFSFLLLFLSFVNFGIAIPSFGGRFQLVFFLFATLYVFLYFLKIPGNKVKMLSWFGLFPMLLYTIVEFRQVSIFINAWILTPGLGLPLLVPGLSIYDVLFP
jgi:hypothetical protein